MGVYLVQKSRVLVAIIATYGPKKIPEALKTLPHIWDDTIALSRKVLHTDGCSQSDPLRALDKLFGAMSFLSIVVLVKQS